MQEFDSVCSNREESNQIGMSVTIIGQYSTAIAQVLAYQLSDVAETDIILRGLDLGHQQITTALLL